MKNPIDAGSDDGISLGFTSDKFEGYLWETDGAIMVSFIISTQPKKGHFSALVKTLFDKGYVVKVPSPLPHMVEVLKHLGFTHTWEDSPIGKVPVWVKSL